MAAQLHRAHETTNRKEARLSKQAQMIGGPDATERGDLAVAEPSPSLSSEEFQPRRAKDLSKVQVHVGADWAGPPQVELKLTDIVG